jgi:hypothetical protein
MELFHASGHRYKPGERLVVRVREGIAPERTDAEQRLARYAPPDTLPRMSARFASDSRAFAALYWNSEANEDVERHLYRVEAVWKSRHPMALVDVVARADDEAIAAAVATEYWSPGHEWRCWEYLCSELEILEEVPWPDLPGLVGAKFSYWEDRKEALRIRP